MASTAVPVLFTNARSNCAAIPGAVGRNIDRSMFMERIEIVCNNCKQAYFANKALGRGF
jgi:hypothetical protein